MQMFSKGQFLGGLSSCQVIVLWPTRISFGQCLVFLFALFLNLFGAMSAGANTREEQITAVKSQMNEAIFKVQDIVNQPVTHLKHTPGMVVTYFSPGWFHPGAEKPDFNTVDIRTTQQLDYSGFQYVSSDLNPGEVFLGAELEFNPMTKYFYTDRLVPKKKLTEAEMLEINQLYRVIGHCEQQLDELQNPEPPLTKIQRLIAVHKPMVIGFMAGVILILLLVRKIQSRE